ncbi:hypothetical protein C2M16_07590 [Escherichia coli]|uniref:Uncharacterized protein n=1 Tax=Escherichia coli TaxID=562 RepID=A0A2K3TVM6_ECOLX|nr:hypothetical protein C2M16_07590 [Escherichia coli]BDI53646.1 hypothetical protein EsCd1KSP079_05067 [Escherichia sp. KS167_9B]
MHTITTVNRSKVKHKKYLGFSLLFNPYYWIFVKPFNGVPGAGIEDIQEKMCAISDSYAV